MPGERIRHRAAISLRSRTKGLGHKVRKGGRTPQRTSVSGSTPRMRTSDGHPPIQALPKVRSSCSACGIAPTGHLHAAFILKATTAEVLEPAKLRGIGPPSAAALDTSTDSRTRTKRMLSSMLSFGVHVTYFLLPESSLRRLVGPKANDGRRSARPATRFEANKERGTTGRKSRAASCEPPRL